MSGKKGMKGVKSHEDSERFPEYYKKRFLELSDEECKRRAEWFRKSCMYQCIEYYEKRFPEATHEEHLRMLEEKKKVKKKVILGRDTNFQCIEYYEKRFPEATHEEHLRMLEEKKKSYLAKRPDNSGINNPSHRSKTTERQRKERSVMCIEYYEKHYPDLSDEERRILMKNKIQEVMYKKSLVPQSTQLQYYINKGMTEEEAHKALSRRQCTFSLEKCIQKYGEEEGRRIFEERQNRWQRSLHDIFKQNGKIFSSKISNELISKIRESGINIESEFVIGRYSFDMRWNNKLIEFNGDYWHANPNMYDVNFLNKVTGMYARDIWKKDANKKKYAESKGYTVLTVWESDYVANQDEVIKKCLKFLND